jgi:hypothetical protein
MPAADQQSGVRLRGSNEPEDQPAKEEVELEVGHVFSFKGRTPGRQPSIVHLSEPTVKLFPDTFGRCLATNSARLVKKQV